VDAMDIVVHSRLNVFATSPGLPSSFAPDCSAIVGRQDLRASKVRFHGTSPPCAASILRGRALLPSTAVRRGAFKGSLGRTLWTTSDRDRAMRWSVWQDLGYFGVAGKSFPMFSTGWFVGVLILFERADLKFGEDFTSVLATSLPVQAAYFLIKPACDLRRDGATVWPGLRSPLLPPSL